MGEIAATAMADHEHRGGDQAAGYRALAAAGLPTVLTGEDLRVATGELRQVSEVLSGADLTAVLRSVPATLEEAFVALSS